MPQAKKSDQKNVTPLDFPETKDAMRWQALGRGQVLSATTHKFFRYIQLVDQKAQVLILLNSILIPVALNWINKDQFTGPAILAIFSAVVSVLFAIVCIYPKRKTRNKGDEDFNILHYSDMAMLSRQEFLDEFMPVFNDLHQLSEAVAKDLHDVASKVIVPKFFLLKLSYTIFFIGNLSAIIWILYLSGMELDFVSRFFTGTW